MTKSLSLDFCFIDHKYIVGRDNHICQGCGVDLSDSDLAKKDLSGYLFKKIENFEDTSVEILPTNIALVCHRCDFYGKPIKQINLAFTGHLIVITGSMFSEKTTTSESYYHNYGVKYKNKVWIKPDRDDRAEDSVTHSGRKINAYTISADRPDRYVDELKQYDVIVIDEAQFFSERIIFLIHQLLKNGCLVIINGLKLTARRDFFGVMHYLLAEADEIISLKAVCNVCMRIDCATRTKSFISNSSTVNIGGVDKYYAVCPACDGGEDEKRFLGQTI